MPNLLLTAGVAVVTASALPEIDYNYFTSELAAGNLMDAIGVPIAADLGIIPLALLGAAIPIPL